MDLRAADAVTEAFDERVGVPPELLAAVLVGAVLRVYRLGAESLWIDEAFMVTMATERTLGQLLFEIPQFEPHPPLYNVFVWAWASVAGTSEVALRSTSVVFGLATLPAAYLLARRLFDRRTATVAVGFLTVSPLQIWYAQEARMYALLVLLTVLSVYLLVSLFDTVTRRRAVGYVAVGVLLGYLHVYGLFVLLAQALTLGVLLLTRRSEIDLSWRHGVGLYGAVGLLTSPWTGLLAHRVLAPEEYPADAAAWLQAPDPSALVETFSLLSFGVTNTTRPYNVLTQPSELFLMVVVVCLLLLGGLFTMGQLAGEKRELTVVVLWLTAPIAVPFALSVTVRPMFELRYTVVVAPAFLILLARSTQVLGDRRLRAVLVALVVIGMLVPLPGYYAEPHKAQWDDAAEYVDERAAPGDTVVVVPGWTWTGPSDAFAYYFDRSDVGVRPLYAFSSDAEYRSAVSGDGDVYLVVSYTNDREAVVDRVASETGTEPTERRTFVNVVVVEYETAE